MKKPVICVLFIILFSTAAFSLPSWFSYVEKKYPEIAAVLLEADARLEMVKAQAAITADKSNQIIDCNGTTLDGGIDVTGKSNVTVRNCVLTGGIGIQSSVNVLVENNSVNGISLMGTCRVTIRKNRLTSGSGILGGLWDSGGVADAVAIEDNYISLSHTSGIYLGAGYPQDFVNLSITGNNIEWSNYSGISIFWGEGVISNNRVTLSGHGGGLGEDSDLYLNGVKNIVVSGNKDLRCSYMFDGTRSGVPVTFEEKQKSGARFRPTTEKDKYRVCDDPFEVSGSTANQYDPSATPATDSYQQMTSPVLPLKPKLKPVKPLTAFGIYLVEGGGQPYNGITISDNTFYTVGTGIYASVSSNAKKVRITNNKVVGASGGTDPGKLWGGGINLALSSADTIVSDNRVERSLYGIRDVGGVANATFRNNVARYNNISGLHIQTGNDVMVVGNDFSLNGLCGADVSISPRLDAENNTLNSNGFCGLALLKSGGGSIVGNTASNNNFTGILLNQSNSGRIENNTLTFNTEYGAYFFSSSQNKIKFNDFRNDSTAGALVNDVKVTSDACESSNTWQNNTWDGDLGNVVLTRYEGENETIEKGIAPSYGLPTDPSPVIRISDPRRTVAPVLPPISAEPVVQRYVPPAAPFRPEAQPVTLRQTQVDSIVSPIRDVPATVYPNVPVSQPTQIVQSIVKEVAPMPIASQPANAAISPRATIIRTTAPVVRNSVQRRVLPHPQP